MDIAEKTLKLKQDFDDVYDAGMKAIVDKIDGLYRFFTGEGSNKGQNMELLPYVLEKDWQEKNINMQYTFQGNKAITEFTPPKNIRVVSPHGLFSGCINLKTVSGLDKMIIGQILTDLFNGCTSLEDAGTINFEGVNFVNRTFQNCTALKEVRIVGKIRLSVSFGESEDLSRESIESVINALDSDAENKTVAFSETAIINAFGNLENDEWLELIGSKEKWEIVLG